jgi:hypothetical protein
MIWFEVINIRLSNLDDHRGFRRLMGEVQRSAVATLDGPKRVILCRNVGTASDWSVHILWHNAESGPHKTGLGLNLAEALRSFGLIDHGVWQEVQQARSTPRARAGMDEK